MVGKELFLCNSTTIFVHLQMRANQKQKLN